MKLKYQCPNCGAPLNYQGFCWRCASEANRQKVLAWTHTQIAENQQIILENIQVLEEMRDPEIAIFWDLLSCHNAITPEIQRKASKEKIYYPSEIYYHAPEDVRDGLISALLSTDDSIQAANLMCYLAMQEMIKN